MVIKMKFKTINPATECEIATYSAMSSDEVIEGIQKSRHAFATWSQTTFAARESKMLKVADILENNITKYATLIANEMGKPLTFGIAEINKCVLLVKHYAYKAEEYLQSEYIETNFVESFVTYQPLGPIFAIMPWNFPFWQVFRFAVPNIMAGNVVILKHAPNCIGAGEAIAEIFAKAGFIKDIFQHFIIDTEQAAQIIANPLVAGVTLTGSERAGIAVASAAGKHLKKSVLELGGNDPYIVMADADLDVAAQNIVTSRLNNSGQVCISAKRIIADKKIIKPLKDKILAIIKTYKVGDPMAENTQCGPLAREDLRDLVHKQVQESIKAGANLVVGGTIPKQKGYYYPPTVLDSVKPGMPAFDDEIFGPVFSIIESASEDEAISLANLSRFGLSSAIFSKDIHKAKRLAVSKIQAGSCFINSMSASNPLLPFGGIKNSGFGRELAKEGIVEFMNVKTIGINN